MQSKCKVIGIGGEKEAGKDTAAQILIDRHGYTRFALADPLKEMCAEAFVIDLADMHNPIKKEKKFKRKFVAKDEHVYQLLLISDRMGIKPTTQQAKAVLASLSGKSFSSIREILQYVGTDVMRKGIADNYWIDLFLAQIKNQTKVVVTDVRFLNERTLVKKMLGGKLVRIHRNSSAVGEHSSENSLGADAEYDHVLHNDGTIEELQQKMQKII